MVAHHNHHALPAVARRARPLTLSRIRAGYIITRPPSIILKLNPHRRVTAMGGNNINPGVITTAEYFIRNMDWPFMIMYKVVRL